MTFTSTDDIQSNWLDFPLTLWRFAIRIETFVGLFCLLGPFSLGGCIQGDKDPTGGGIGMDKGEDGPDRGLKLLVQVSELED